MISNKQISEISRIIANKCQPEKIILFGSYASGTAIEDSDLDIAIVKNTELPRFKRGAEIRSALRSNGKKWLFAMDIVVYTPQEWEDWRNDPYSLVHEIQLTGKTLYESTQSTRLVH
jgi:uncharacterized protein